MNKRVYKIFDRQVGNYVAPPCFDDGQWCPSWTLQEAKDFVISKHEEWVDEDCEEYRPSDIEYLNQLKTLTSPDDIADALLAFDYELEDWSR